MLTIEKLESNCKTGTFEVFFGDPDIRIEIYPESDYPVQVWVGSTGEHFKTRPEALIWICEYLNKQGLNYET